MTSLIRNRITVAAAIGVPCAVALWLLTTATAAVPSTYVLTALLLISIGLIGLNTWNNSQPTGSMAQVIHEADITPGTKADVRDAGETSASRWNAWQARGDGLSHTGRIRALVVLSAVVTGALLFYGWRS